MPKIVIVPPNTTLTAPAIGTGVDVSSPKIGDFALVLSVTASTPDLIARFQFTDSVDNFVSDKLSGPPFVVPSGLAPPCFWRRTIKRYDYIDLRLGVAGAKLRLDLTRLIGTNPSVTFESWLEY